jgi:hypothetical protein
MHHASLATTETASYSAIDRCDRGSISKLRFLRIIYRIYNQLIQCWKKLWKSFNICPRYGQKYRSRSLFWLAVYIWVKGNSGASTVPLMTHVGCLPCFRSFLNCHINLNFVSEADRLMVTLDSTALGKSSPVRLLEWIHCAWIMGQLSAWLWYRKGSSLSWRL